MADTGHDDIHYEEVLLSDMDFEDGVYYYECPCGDLFEITEEEIAKGEDVAHCPSCSLTLKVIMPKAEPAPEPQPGKPSPADGTDSKEAPSADNGLDMGTLALGD